MKKILSWCFLVVVLGVVQAFPGKYGLYYPKRSVMFGSSYYSNPMEGFEYVPQGQMTAMVSGDTVATNTFSGQPWKAQPSAVVPSFSSEEVLEDHPAVEQLPEQKPEKYHPVSSENEADADVEFEAGDSHEEASSSEVVPTTEAVVVVPTTKAPKVRTSKKTNPKRKVKKPVKQEEEIQDDDDEDEAPVWPFGASNSRKASSFPGYNTFFPIFIGSPGSSRSRTRSSGNLEDQDEGLMPSGSATAIANSFSTGKGGVATSHATSFGDPMAAAFLRNSGYFGDYEGFMRKNKKPATRD